MTVPNVPLADLIAHLQALIPARMKDIGVPALSIALIRQGRLAWSKTFGVKHAELRHPATQGTVFEAASLSKPVFAYGVLPLCARGLLNLDTPLTEYAPTPYIPGEPLLNMVTARTVLCHTTGLQNWLWAEGEQPSIHFTPGTRFSYSSLGYMYLQQVVEHVTGQPLAQLMRENVLDRLRMRHSSFAWREDYDIDAAIGHDDDGKPAAKWKPAQALACASLHTTARDYARFLMAMMSERDDVAEEMLQPQARVNDDISWGLGWGLVRTPDRDAFWHWGDNGVFKALALGSRAQQRGLIVLTNSAKGLTLCRELLREVEGPAIEQPLSAWLADFYGH
jgi:CubicO group peptidase (beta-lactamase class C family)